MTRFRSRILVGVVAVAVLTVAVGRGVRSLLMTKGTVAAYVALISAVRGQDIDRVRSLCSRRYLKAKPIVASDGGGVVGFPMNIHKNYQVWPEGDDEVRLCPSDRVGLVYRFVRESNVWKFDGLVGVLEAGGRVDPSMVVEENP